MAAEEFAQRTHAEAKQNRGSYVSAGVAVGTMTVVIAWPLLFMNNSGPAVADILDDYEITSEDILIISDDVALPLGALRVRAGGSHGGHNGLRSIIDTLGTETFPRMRCGINSEAYGRAADLADFVLSPFPVDEQATALAMISRSAGAIETFIRSGIDATMTQFNT
jgi:PTH1 family peptidyl-tRNA hydrolase